MPTPLYLVTGAGTPISPGRGTNTPNQQGANVGWRNFLLRNARGVGSISESASTQNGPFTNGGIEVGSGTTPCEWISEPLAAALTISGTITFNIWGSESSMNANATLRVIVERVGPTGTILSTVINSAHASELGTTAAAMNWTGTPTSTTFAKGDRIRVRVLITDGGGTMVTGFTAGINFGGASSGATGESYVSFNETITFMATPAGSTLYCSDAASDVSVGVDERKLSLARGSGNTQAARDTVAGWTSPLQWKLSGTDIEWYTDAFVEAATLTGKARINFYALENDISYNVGVRAEIAICDGDGSNAVVWGAANIGGSGEVGTSAISYQIDVAGPDVSISAGQRIRLRFYADDSNNTPMASSTLGASLYFGANGGSQTGDTYVILPIKLPQPFDQDSYRFRNDDGSETTATWAQPVNTPHAIALDTSFRLRIVFHESIGSDPSSQPFYLQYRRKPSGGSYGAWTTVSGASHVAVAASSNFAHQDLTTRQIWPTEATFTSGVMHEGAGTLNNDLNANIATEYEWCLRALSSVGAADGDEYELRVVASNDLTIFQTYTSTPVLTIGAAGGPTPVAIAASATLTPAMTLLTKRFRNVDAAAVISPAVSKKIPKSLPGTMTLTPTLGKSKPVTLSGSLVLTPAQTKVKKAPRSVDAALSLTAALTQLQKYNRAVPGSLVLTPAVQVDQPSGLTPIQLDGALILSPAISKRFYKRLMLGPNYRARILSLVPVVYLRMGEPSGTTAVDAAGTQDGTYVNSPSLGQSGALGGDSDTAVDFTPGSSQYVSFSTVAAHRITGDLTIEAWVWDDGGVTARAIASLRDGANLNVPYSVRIASGGVIQYTHANASAFEPKNAPSGLVPTGQWTYIVVTRTGGNIRFYVNGVLRSTQGFSLTPTADATKALRIGAQIDGTYYDGKLDEVAIYNYALSDEQIMDNFITGLGNFGLTSITPAMTADERTVVFKQLDAGLVLTPTLSPLSKYFRAIAGSLVLTPTQARVAKYQRALSAGLTLTPAISKRMARLIAGALTLTPTMARLQKRNMALPASMTLTPTLARVPFFPRLLAATLTLTPNLTRIAKYQRAIPASAVLTPNLGRLAKYFRTLNGSAVLTAALTTDSTTTTPISLPANLVISAAQLVQQKMYRSIPASLVLTPAQTRIAKYQRAISGNLVLSPAMQKLIPRILAQNLNFTPNMTKVKLAPRSIAASLVLTPAQTRLFRYQRALGASVTLSAAQTRVLRAYRAFDASAGLTAALTKRVFAFKTFQAALNLGLGFSKSGSGTVQLDGLLNFTPNMVKLVRESKTLAASLPITPDLTRVKKAPRTLAATTTLTAALVKVKKAPRTLAANLVFTPTLARVAKYKRAFDASLSLTVTLAKLSRLLRRFDVILTLTPTLDADSLTHQFISMPATVNFTASLSRLAKFNRTFAVTLNSNPQMARVAKFQRTLQANLFLAGTQARVMRAYRQMGTPLVLTAALMKQRSARLVNFNLPIILTPDFFRGQKVPLELDVAISFLANLSVDVKELVQSLLSAGYFKAVLLGADLEEKTELISAEVDGNGLAIEQPQYSKPILLSASLGEDTELEGVE